MRIKFLGICLIILASTFFFNCQIADEENPIAYGTVDLDGIIYGGSGNFTVAHTAVGTYEITINGYTATINNTSVYATISSGIGAPVAIYWMPVGNGNVMILIRGAAGAMIDADFSFTIWKI